MHLRLRGLDVPQPLLDTIAAITDHAKLHTGNVHFDRPSETVHFDVTRFPLWKQRKTLGNLHDVHHPISAVVTIRNVIACDIDDHGLDESLGEITLLFGLKIERDEMFAFSAEERQGHTCYTMRLKIGDLDIEIADQPGT